MDKLKAKLICLVLLGIGLSLAGSSSLPRQGEIYTVCPEGPPRCPFSMIQSAIDAAEEGDAIVVGPGNYKESLKITKSLSLLGVGQELVTLEAAEEDLPAVLIEGERPIEVAIGGFTIYRERGLGYGCFEQSILCSNGIVILGEARAEIREIKIWSESRVRGRGVEKWREIRMSESFLGIVLSDEAYAEIRDVTVSWNKFGGILIIGGSAEAEITDSEISHSWGGIYMMNSAQATITNSDVSHNGLEGIWMRDSARAVITDSKISENGSGGILMWGAKATVEGSIIEGNGRAEECKEKEPDVFFLFLFGLCSGIEVSGEAHLEIIDSTIRANADWGVSAHLKECGYYFDNFTGRVIFKGTNIIESNDILGDQEGRGNPGAHPWNRPEVPDGQVCLP